METLLDGEMHFFPIGNIDPDEKSFSDRPKPTADSHLAKQKIKHFDQGKSELNKLYQSYYSTILPSAKIKITDLGGGLK